MKKKNFILLTVLAGLTIFLTSSYFINASSPDELVFNETHDSFEKKYDDVSELEKSAELIVEAKATDEKNNQVIMDGDFPLYYWTESKFEVEKIHKNNFGIKENDVITVNEPYAFINENDVFISEGYEMSEVGAKYLLFLAKKENEDKYLPIAVYHGKYNMNFNGKKQLSNRMNPFEIENPNYVKLKNSVKEKYNFD
ncbi:hypothetical protein FJQ98_25155 [Lysinibacillus agricola]|uniref:Uncharacterized protein n=1 Tax=Lysinibacillus agricola TaxID=2590012 RepID=A0ABX7AQV3_9BACI|nr:MULTISPECIES: hypothetical protein [Lysinibacillus]KOS61647.1 hypothetical protein AN161_16825 [Lysinibacillus sp. FJAT-14222]QQP12338.1 hypothetical protein FJQ98_25155 [Lysinibacillus agricola]